VAYHLDSGEVADAQCAVTFAGAHLIVLDHLNGSGHDVPIETITATWAPRRVTIDAPYTGRGYSWHEIAGPVSSAYGGTYTLRRDAAGPVAGLPSRA
jgi:hypothetical protein